MLGCGRLAHEEILLEERVVQIITAGDLQTLKPTSSRSVAVGDHHICVTFLNDLTFGYRVSEWHGLILLYDDENGYVPEHVYGNFFYFWPLPKNSNGLCEWRWAL
ncbi:hypothetical protein GOP47_0007121 [Adiantum capillus-veneris]|uniref:Uncharacterized protein n=1 Tax=Adiantum capillus-veneris TaxID=13818 RepID=A0A9D4V0X6_ADICA|nr:hypothetical protein GOP47_0007121 [Adiantum capillus-veneris]